MHFHVKMLEKGRNDILRDKQTTKKVAPIFSDVKVIYGTITILGLCEETRKVECTYIAFQKLKIRYIRMVNSSRKNEKNRELMFFEVKTQTS